MLENLLQGKDEHQLWYLILPKLYKTAIIIRIVL